MKRQPVQCYQERDTGDYLYVEYAATENAGPYYQQRKNASGYRLWEARAAAIQGDPSSCCSTSVSSDFLRKCRKVEAEAVPSEWMRYLDPCGEDFPTHSWIQEHPEWVVGV
jgi:hypothetical protein